MGKPKTKQKNPQILLAFNKGFESGAKHQRESDIVHLAGILENLEDAPGIGGKTAEKVRKYFMERFGGGASARD